MPEFYEPHSRGVLVRSPVEYTVAALRQLEAKTDMSVPAGDLIAMGQTLFDPLDAKGPEGDLTWINTGTVFARASTSKGCANAGRSHRASNSCSFASVVTSCVGARSAPSRAGASGGSRSSRCQRINWAESRRHSAT